MKKIIVVGLVVLLAILSTRPVAAGGGKVHGDRAAGPAYQLGDTPFGRQ